MSFAYNIEISGGLDVCRKSSKTRFQTVVLFISVCICWSKFLYSGEKYAGASRPSCFHYWFWLKVDANSTRVQHVQTLQKSVTGYVERNTVVLTIIQLTTFEANSCWIDLKTQQFETIVSNHPKQTQIMYRNMIGWKGWIVSYEQTISINDIKWERDIYT